MKIKSMKTVFLGGMVAAVLSCITVNIYFPETEVRKTAEDIVNDVRGSDKAAQDEIKKDPVIKSAGFSLVPRLHAQQETEVTTPGIRALKESMKTRFAGLVSFFDAGRIGETMDGFLKILNEDGFSLQDKAGLRNIVKDENQDRKNLYHEVAQALNIDSAQIDRVQKIFAEQWIGKARTGWMIQKNDGFWVKK
ncbi:MAG: YdbL family probable chaperone protein [Candidatus Aminicenantales bacterium]